MKKFITILFLFSVAFFFPEISLGEKTVLEPTQDIAVESRQSAGNPSDALYLFAVQRAAESGVNSLRLLPEISVYVSLDDLSKSLLIQANTQHRAEILIRHSRVLDHHSELSKFIYPFHFFF